MQAVISGEKGPSVFDTQDLYDDFDMDEVDFRIENYEELFGAALDNPDQLFANDGMDGIFGTKDMSESNRQGAFSAKVLFQYNFLLHICWFWFQMLLFWSSSSVLDTSLLI